MIDELNEQLIEIKGELRKKRKWEQQLADYKQELTETQGKIYDLKEKLASEQSDVDKLEGFSVTKWFLTMKGTVAERLDKEKQEVAAVQLKLEEATRSKDEIDESINDLNKRLGRLRNIKRDYHDTLAKKEMYIKANHLPTSIQLDKLTELEGDMKAFLNELEEAVSAGNAVNQALERAIDYLEKAEGWGTLDMFGGGVISGAIKHNHIDQATEYIHQAQTRMRQFQKELADINDEVDMHIDIPGLLKFADFFFDGLIADWMVQGRINDSLQQTQTQHRKISSLLSDLKRQAELKRHELEKIKGERKILIESV
ncbi:hypothetical protein [Bacillus sp. Marseille-Q3570]|uniref:hypothetical protein n=1 Tax=Bacillus sp. Marseille-Q3570 TaxID=2963522 RepID=UPI0021B75466|nr:hypothetical protein [Bacillus sp. Marseille-Q3570]